MTTTLHPSARYGSFRFFFNSTIIIEYSSHTHTHNQKKRIQKHENEVVVGAPSAPLRASKTPKMKKKWKKTHISRYFFFFWEFFSFFFWHPKEKPTTTTDRRNYLSVCVCVWDLRSQKKNEEHTRKQNIAHTHTHTHLGVPDNVFRLFGVCRMVGGRHTHTHTHTHTNTHTQWW